MKILTTLLNLNTNSNTTQCNESYFDFAASEITFTCDHSDGEETIACGADGQWPIPTLECPAEVMTCDSPPSPLDIQSDFNGNLEEGAAVTYTCPSGAVTTAVCIGGSWSATDSDIEDFCADNPRDCFQQPFLVEVRRCEPSV